LSVALNGARQPVITWQATPGVNYRVEYKPDLHAGIWGSLATVPATGTTASYTDVTVGTNARRFYRIVKP
jgi:hypothetical protein